MTTDNAIPVNRAKPNWRRRVRRAIFRNPVTVKELRSRMRGNRAFVVLTLYLMLMGGLISMVYLIYALATRSPGGNDVRMAGKVIFGAVMAIQIFLVIFIGPAFTAGAISGEKERQTYDLLRTTLLSPHYFVLGKLLSALSYVGLLVLVSIPLQSVAFVLGGVAIGELIVAQLLIFVSAVAYALLGLYCSSITNTTLGSSALTFLFALLLVFGLPLLAIVFGSLLGAFLFAPSGGSDVGELLLAAGAWLLSITNLPITVIFSEMLLINEHSYLGFSTTVGGQTVYVPSTWYFYIGFYSFVSLCLYWSTVRRVKRVAKR